MPERTSGGILERFPRGTANRTPGEIAKRTAGGIQISENKLLGKYLKEVLENYQLQKDFSNKLLEKF